MKQCTGCGKRYEDTQTTCPGCWSRTWVTALEGAEQVQMPANAYPCAECGFYAAAGTPVCPHCKTKLRPRMLEGICIVGLLGSPLAFVYGILHMLQTHSYWLIADLLLWIATGVACWALLKGSYRGYRGMQAVLIGGPALMLVLTIVASLLHTMAAQDLSSLMVARLFAGVLLFLLLRYRSIQDYCAQGKPQERYAAKAVFQEQTHTTKTHRVGSTITRNL